ncbi:MAG: hypothetical protein V4787_11495 [Pseudomonadota bacterium]
MRQKNVFDRDALCHAWAHGLQDSGRDKAGSMFFTGSRLYSYGSHYIIALRVPMPDGSIGYIVNGEQSTMTTESKHKPHARRAIPSYAVQVRVPSLNDGALRNPAGIVAACVNASTTARNDASVTRAGTMKRSGLESSARAWADSARALVDILPAYPTSSDAATLRAHRAALRKELRRLAPVPGMDDAAAWSRIAADVYAAQLADAFKAYAQRIEWLANEAHALSMDATPTDYRIADAERSLADLDTRRKNTARLVRLSGKRSPITAKLAKSHGAAVSAMRAAIDAGAEQRASNAVAECARQWSTVTAENEGKVNAQSLQGRVRTVTEALPHLTGDAYAAASDLLNRMDGCLQRVREANRRSVAIDKVEEARGLIRNARESELRLRYDNAISHANRARSCLEQARAQWPDVPVSFELISSATLEDWYRLELAEQFARVAAWRRGEGMQSQYHLSPTPMLRIVGDTIQTSHGASVPLSVAPIMWRAIGAARRLNRDLGPAALGLRSDQRIGHFELRTVRADGSCVIGCHDIPAAEFERIAAQLGYVNAGEALPVESTNG